MRRAFSSDHLLIGSNQGYTYLVYLVLLTFVLTLKLKQDKDVLPKKNAVDSSWSASIPYANVSRDINTLTSQASACMLMRFNLDKPVVHKTSIAYFSQV